MVFCGDRKGATDFIIQHPDYKGQVVVGAFVSAGDDGTATAGHGGKATAGRYGTATAGYGGRLHIEWYDHKADRYRTSVAYVGENGIKANVVYKLDTEGNFVEA